MYEWVTMIEHGVSEFMRVSIGYVVLLCEFVGLVIVTGAVIMAIIRFIKKDEYTRIKFAEKLALALEFKMAGEILRTMVVSNFTEVIMLATIIGVRALLSVLIMWGIRSEESRLKRERKLKEQAKESPSEDKNVLSLEESKKEQEQA